LHWLKLLHISLLFLLLLLGLLPLSCLSCLGHLLNPLALCPLENLILMIDDLEEPVGGEWSWEGGHNVDDLSATLGDDVVLA